MLTEKEVEALRSAPAEDRYWAFVKAAAETKQVWLGDSDEGTSRYVLDGKIHILVWPYPEVMMLMENEMPVCMEVNDFLRQCDQMDDDVNFLVFLTEEDAYAVSVRQLCFDLELHVAGTMKD